MATAYVKGVRTRFRNTLENDLQRGREFLKNEPLFDSDDYLMEINKCIERIRTYSEKVEIQSEKFASTLEESDSERVEEVISEDCELCSCAMDVYLELKQLKDTVELQNRKYTSKSEVSENTQTHELIELQKNMQYLLSMQMNNKEEKYAVQKKIPTVKLPVLDINSFSGDKTYWFDFWDSFESAIHRNEMLSNVEKFNYLKSKLCGDARSAIVGLSLTNENYPVAVELLKNRFANKQEIVDLHYTRMINIQAASTSIISLRSFADTLRKHLRSLEVLSQDIQQDIFVSVIRSKLPEEVLVQLEMRKGIHTRWTVNSLTTHLNEYIVARERANTMTSAKGAIAKSSNQNSLKDNQKTSVKSQGQTESKTSTLLNSDSKSNSTKKTVSPNKKCCYCEKGHWSDECDKYTTIKERKECIKGHCYKCLKKGHLFRECKSNKACVYCGEMNVHHRSLCPHKFKVKQSMVNMVCENSNSVLDSNANPEESGLMSMNEMVLMQTALTEIKKPGSTETASVRLLLDSGSHRSYICERLAKKLNLQAEGEQDINVVTFGSKRSKRITTKYTKVDLKIKDGKHLQMYVNIVPLISGELQRKNVRDMNSDKIQEIVKSVDLADDIPNQTESSPIEFLIGNDYYLDLIQGTKIELQPGLYLLASKLGWILSGRTSDMTEEYENSKESNMLVLTYGNDVTKSSVYTPVDESNPSKVELEDFWNLESLGIVDKVTNTDDEIALERFRNTLKFDNNRYSVTWPWKDSNPNLPNNRELAFGRLKSTVVRMKTRPEVLKKYDEVIADQLQKGVIEKVDPKKSDGIVHHIPHHAVVTPQKTTTKLRVVYDASAKTKQQNLSLNDCLYRGPVMLHDLTGMLMRFRMFPVALVADIEKAFLQIGLQPDQRDVTRFMWLKDIADPDIKCSTVQEYRFCRVPFGVISSPFLLGATIEYHLESYQSDIAEKIKSDIYVDNMISGTNSIAEAKLMYKEAKRMFDEGSMNLREWISNNEDVVNSFSDVDKSVDVECTKVLGHEWHIKQDLISLKLNKIDNKLPVTKRSVLRQIASVFDPLGLLCPVVLPGKVFLQDLWREGIEWDESLDLKTIERWYTILKGMEGMPKCCVPRCVQTGNSNSENLLLCFCDASKKAYSTVIYLFQRSGNQYNINVVFAKTRLAPVKQLSIPRLELLAVVIGLKCLKYVQDQLKVSFTRTYLWTDSQCTLQWINSVNSNRKVSVFVRNRLNVVKEFKDVRIGYVPSEQNPADIASRGTTAFKLLTNDLWWRGPKWLAQPSENWSKFDYTNCNEVKRQVATEIREIEEEKQGTITLTSNCASLTDCPAGILYDKYSSLTKLLRITAWVLRFIRRLRKKGSEQGFLTRDELDESEKVWIQYVQKKHYQDVLTAIENKKTNSIQHQLGLFSDSKGILRCKGRMENAELTESARVPILLPKSDYFTTLVVEKTHRELLHSGVSQTLSLIRYRFWIPHGRAVVKKVLKSCRVCRRFEGGPYKMPPMCSFPKSKVSEARPFQKVGLDYLGPFMIKHTTDNEKVWICLFTCIVTRAIHLELVCDMSSGEFLMCFRRFIAQRGTPSEIISDNAMQFRTASTVLDRLWNHICKNDEILTYVSNAGVKWVFNVELAPWMGGFYERLVSLVKRAMRKSIGRKLLTLIQFQTIIKEIEAVLNSRPLVYVGDDISSTLPISPAHFLTNNPKTGIPELENTDDDDDYQPVKSYTEKLIKMWKKGQVLLDSFWKVWHQDYLTSLRERSQSRLKAGRVNSSFEPKENDVVLIKDDVARGQWRFGKITSLIKSSDQNVRSAKVVLPSGREIGRTLNLLYPLEISESQNSEEQCSTVKTSANQESQIRHLRQPTKRLAAELAIERIKALS